MTTKVIVGISGGVDSAVAAYLLCERGHHQVEGLFMKNWEEDDDAKYCAAAVDLADAQAVCQQLGIPLHTVNFSSEYWHRVFAYFLEEYRAGRTPNPDIICNKEIKFSAFLDYARTLDANCIATGHYADSVTRSACVCLMKGADKSKDQSYFLHTLNAQQLQNTLFPLGKLTKAAVRSIAKTQKFAVHDKKDSTGICFIGERKFKDFLKNYIPAQAGDIVTTNGEKIGRHEGIMFYTIGQRQGLGIGGRSNLPGEPWYVVDKDSSNNQLFVAQGHENPALFHSTVITRDIHWIAGCLPADTVNIMARIRYRQTDQPCTIRAIAHEKFEISFATPQWAVTPGQSIVFYQQDTCLGGAIIEGRRV